MAQFSPDLNRRIHYMDHLRASAMLLGVVYHAAAAYAVPVHFNWMVKHDPTTDILTVFRMLSHDFRMPLFYLISGFFAYLLFEKRGAWPYLGNRVIRVLLPLLIFAPLITFTIIESYKFAYGYLKTDFYTFMFIPEPEEAGKPNTAHLWFLRYLFEFCIITLLIQWIRHPIIDKTRKAIFSSSWALLLLPILIIPGHFLSGENIKPPINLPPEIWSYLYYGVYFFIGWHIFKQQNFIKTINDNIWKLIIAATVLFLFQIYYKYPDLGIDKVELPLILTVSLFSYLKLYLGFIALGLGQRFLDTNRQWMRYMSDASYWIYIAHIPVLLICHILLSPLTMSLWLKFLISTVITLSITTSTYHILIRYTPIGWMLNGKRGWQDKQTNSENMKTAVP